MPLERTLEHEGTATAVVAQAHRMRAFHAIC